MGGVSGGGEGRCAVLGGKEWDTAGGVEGEDRSIGGFG